MIRNPLSRLVLAGLVTGVIEGLFSSVLSVAFYDSTVTRLFQGDLAESYDPEHHEVTRRYLDSHIAPFRTNREIIGLLEPRNQTAGTGYSL